MVWVCLMCGSWLLLIGMSVLLIERMLVVWCIGYVSISVLSVLFVVLVVLVFIVGLCCSLVIVVIVSKGSISWLILGMVLCVNILVCNGFMLVVR